MIRFLKPKMLPIFSVVMGAAGMALRFALYLFCLDEKNLLPVSHPLMNMLWLVTAIALAGIAYGVWPLAGSNRYGDNFRPSRLAAAGHVLAGVGFALTALLNVPMMENYLGTAWRILGLLSGPCLILAGLARAKGKRPFFLLHMIPCLFLVLHIINHYQTWSGNPQMMDYFFALFGIIGLTLFAYYNTAFDVGSGTRRMYLGMGLAAVYLCIVSIPENEYLFLYVSGILWVLSELCSLNHQQRSQSPEEGETAYDPS